MLESFYNKRRFIRKDLIIHTANLKITKFFKLKVEIPDFPKCLITILVDET